MSIFGSLGKLFGYKGASAEAFGGAFAEKASTTFTDRLNKSIDSFEKQEEETDKLLLADELSEAKIVKEELSEALKGVKEKVAIGWSPGVAAAIHSAPAETQKIMIDAANSMEDKSTAALDNLWKTSVEINKEMPTLSVMDAAKLLVGNQVRTEFDYDTIPQTDNMLTRLGFKPNLRDSIKSRVESRPNMRPDLTVDTEAIIPIGGPSADALDKAKKINAKDKQPKDFDLENELISLEKISYKGSFPNSSAIDVVNGLEADLQSTRLQVTFAAKDGKYIADAMIKNNQKMGSNPSFVTTDNTLGLTIFANKNFIKSVKDIKIAGENESDEEKQNVLKSNLKQIFLKIQTVYGNEAVKQLANLIK